MKTASLLEFGKYDFTINKVFYRNMVILAISIGAGLTLSGFLMRWLIYNNSGTGNVPVTSGAHFSQASFTAFMLMSMANLLSIVFVGCTFHNLRTKQGRINELTLPVSTGKKYAWHLLVSIVGGFATILLTLLCSDLLNFTLHLLVFGNNHTFSLIGSIISLYASPFSSSVGMMMSPIITKAYLFILAGFFANIGLFVYGNSVKYRFNIIITYGILQGISTFAMIFGLIFLAAIEPTKNFLDVFYYFGIFAFIAIGILSFWRSYVRYRNAQVTTRLNK